MFDVLSVLKAQQSHYITKHQDGGRAFPHLNLAKQKISRLSVVKFGSISTTSKQTKRQ